MMTLKKTKTKFCYFAVFLFFSFFSLTAYSKSFNKDTATDCFEATNACPAYQSFRKQTNPGNIRLEKNKQYPVLEENRNRTRFRIQMDGIERPARWVESHCGTHLFDCRNKSVKNKDTSISVNKKSRIKKKSGQYLLALSWEPSFCETHSRKKECRTLNKNRYDASHLSLHGLWPQPRANAYCGVSETDKGIDRNKRWHLLEPVKLSQEVIKKLVFIMPGYASNLHRHEWIKHGTCYGTNANTYYDHSITLTEQVNQSSVGKLLAENIGKKVSLRQIRQAFDSSFGKGAGEKVDLRCDRKGRISELWINLKGEMIDKSSSELDISRLLQPALRAGSTCQSGLVDAVD